MEPYTVQAEYSFQRQNNDELQFKKGDIITVTQCEDGGWWEGTLGDMTGWFPSNYVKEYKAPTVSSETVPDIQANRSVVLDDLLESEKAHVAEIRGLLENFLEPLASSQLLTGDEYAQLMSNFIEVVQTHEELLTSLEDCNDRVGKLFLSKATLMKNVHQAYCAAHPRAIVILDKYKDELETFMEERGAAKPGLLVLTTGLSKAFRRLDKYSAMLQELERHMESGHPDRGNTQRSVAVYKDIASVCSATRRQKELELQVLTGPVRGWQGQELSTLGDIIHMGSVAVGPEHRDRYFVLFPQTLLILSVSQRMSAFIYEGKLPLTGITVSRLEDTDSIKNAFEVSGPLIEKIVAVCQGPNEANKWVDLISAHPGAVRQQNSDEMKRNTTSAVNITQPPSQNHPQGLGTSQPNKVTTPPPPQHKRSLSFNHHLSYNQFQSHQSNKHPNPVHQDRIPLSVGLNGRNSIKDGCWQITNLRPAPPLRPSTSNSNSASSGALSSYSRKPQPTHEEDALVLRVFEAYCAAYQNTSRNTMHSGNVLIAGLENEDMTPTLKQLWVTVRQLQQDMAQAKVQINEERALRCHLQQMLMGHLESVCISNNPSGSSN
ncbi:hypothetical protein HA402_000955 [Bradysia odoriphaga]|nr:hypothetical protein HA402_000955 [Bradysia odoriphaga]